MESFPPADEVQQVVSVDAQSFVRQTADIFAIEITIDPANLSARLIQPTSRPVLCSTTRTGL